MANSPLPWQEEQSLSAGIVRAIESYIYVWPSNYTSLSLCPVEKTSKSFAVPPVTGTSAPRPTGMMVYRADAFWLTLGGPTPFGYSAGASTVGGYIPGATNWFFPLHPNVQTAYVFDAADKTSVLYANWTYGR